MRRRLCVTKRWKRERAVSGAPASPASLGASRVFTGTLYVAALTIDAPRGPWAMSEPDLRVAIEYLARVTPAIQAYASQYGPARVNVAPSPIPMTVPLRRPQYSDGELQGWIDQMASRPGIPSDAAIVVLNPPGATNTDARESGGVGVLGYHGLARVPYCFVNVLGHGFSMGDPADYFAEALSHEVAEMTVDPRADGSQPEVCDGCGTNCHGERGFRIFFGSGGTYIGGSADFPPPFPYDYFISAVAAPPSAGLCPAPEGACVYPPPSG